MSLSPLHINQNGLVQKISAGDEQAFALLYSGNANSWCWSGKFKRSANWWDTVGFGHDDAYGNMLAYRACTLLAQVAVSINKKADSDYYNTFAATAKQYTAARQYQRRSNQFGAMDRRIHRF